MPIFCTACGTQLKTDEKFCTSCGQAQHPSSSSAPLAKKEKSKKMNYKALIFSVIAVTILCVGAIYGSNNDDAIEKSNSAMENYNRGGDSTDTINTLDEAAKLAEGETKIESLKNLAFVYISEDEQKEALKTFKEALSLISDKSLNYYLISGNIAELEGNSQAALADYNKALTIDPNDFQTNNSLGTLYLGLSTSTEKFTDYNKALKYNKKAYDIDKQEAAIGNLALSYYFLENYDQTISLLLQTSLENKGSNNFWLGLAYLNKKDFIHARIYFQKAVNLGMEVPPEVQSFLDNSNDQ